MPIKGLKDLRSRWRMQKWWNCIWPLFCQVKNKVSLSPRCLLKAECAMFKSRKLECQSHFLAIAPPLNVPQRSLYHYIAEVHTGEKAERMLHTRATNITHFLQSRTSWTCSTLATMSIVTKSKFHNFVDRVNFPVCRQCVPALLCLALQIFYLFL